MGNPVRPWRNFLTAWENLDAQSQIKLISDCMRTIGQLRAHQKDINSRIAYWENNLSMAREARRSLEFKGRSRERHDRVVSKDSRAYHSRFEGLKDKASRA